MRCECAGSLSDVRHVSAQVSRSQEGLPDHLFKAQPAACLSILPPASLSSRPTWCCFCFGRGFLQTCFFSHLPMLSGAVCLPWATRLPCLSIYPQKTLSLLNNVNVSGNQCHNRQGTHLEYLGKVKILWGQKERGAWKHTPPSVGQPAGGNVLYASGDLNCSSVTT